MTTYIMPMARNLRTGETVKAQDLTNKRYQPHQRVECQLIAERLALQMTERSQDPWSAKIVEYSA